jgi:glycosyltransferase involved in cell wall biosynthesis
MDPNRVEMALVREEEKRWPKWSMQSLEVPEAYFQRREQEWALADRVVVNSIFCRDALVKQGVPPAKLVVIPLCYEAEAGNNRQGIGEGQGTADNPSFISDFTSCGPLRVLFLGQVILRKGIQYLMQAAKLLEHENIHFDIVGPVGISDLAVASAPRNLSFHGRATRDQTPRWYRQSHVFVLPTLSDGFAITQLEAMSYGLPVIATPCCGAVASDGVDGFIVPPRSPEALARALQRYLSEPGLLKAQHQAALEKSRRFSLARLAENLRCLEITLKDSR